MSTLSLEGGFDLYIDLLKKALTASIYDESAWKIIPSTPPSLRSGKSFLRYFALLLASIPAKVFRMALVFLVWERPFVIENREQGKDWPLFGYTMTGHRRLDKLQECIEDVLEKGIRGDFIETGAWRGGSCIFMRALLRAYGIADRKVWVADSFEGLPKPKSKSDGWDLSNVEFLKVSLEEVRHNFDRFGLLDNQVQFLPGWFCDTLPAAPIQELAILRLDGDMYSSTMDSLQNLYHKVSKEGYVIVDDYYTWSSCRTAVTDFLAKNSLSPEIKKIDWGAAYWKV